MSKDGISFQYIEYINFALFIVKALRKISKAYYSQSCLGEHSKLVRFEKHAAKTLQHRQKYGHILMLYDMINTQD